MDLDAIRYAEQDLLDPATRRDAERLRALLHPDFVEIGRSGRLWSRDETIAALAVERERPAALTDEWRLVEVSPGLVLVTYRLRAGGSTSRHASLWQAGPGGPVIRFHQGTPVSGQDSSPDGVRSGSDRSLLE